MPARNAEISLRRASSGSPNALDGIVDAGPAAHPGHAFEQPRRHHDVDQVGAALEQQLASARREPEHAARPRGIQQTVRAARPHVAERLAEDLPERQEGVARADVGVAAARQHHQVRVALQRPRGERAEQRGLALPRLPRHQHHARLPCESPLEPVLERGQLLAPGHEATTGFAVLPPLTGRGSRADVQGGSPSRATAAPSGTSGSPVAGSGGASAHPSRANRTKAPASSSAIPSARASPSAIRTEGRRSSDSSLRIIATEQPASAANWRWVRSSARRLRYSQRPNSDESSIGTPRAPDSRSSQRERE